jgi:hypothetical protein
MPEVDLFNKQRLGKIDLGKFRLDSNNPYLNMMNSDDQKVVYQQYTEH